jgi:hypothetical protein
MNKITSKISINQYLHNQLGRAPTLLQKYTQDENGNKYLPRNIFVRIKKLVDDYLDGQRELRIVAIPGLRGVGKTTLLAQVFMDLYKRRPENLLYISADQITNILRSDLDEVFEEYQKILGSSLEAFDKQIFVFIDEIHFDPKWPAILKMLYDRTKNLFVICTGSSALSLQSTTDLARRVIFEPLYPMNFTEYMLLKTQYQASGDSIIRVRYPIPGLKNQIKQILFFSRAAEDCFAQLQGISNKVNQYWLEIDKLEIDKYLKFGSMPFALSFKDESRIYELLNESIDKIMEKDLPSLNRFNPGTIRKAKNVLFMAAGSNELSLNSLARFLREISFNTLSDLFNAFEKAELLIRVYPYGSAYKTVRKPSKYHFMSSAIRHTLLGIAETGAFENNKGRYLEDAVVLTLYREFSRKFASPIFYDAARGGADFILQLLEKRIVIEVGFGGKGVRQAEYTLEKVKGSYGLVIAKTRLSLENQVVKVPLEYFLLM